MEGGVAPDPFARPQAKGSGGGSSNDTELMCRMLPIENKLFWFDLKDNPRGRYLKLCEKRSGKRSTVVVPASGVPELLALFSYYAQIPENETIGERKMTVDAKTFFFEIGTNARGRFLKLEERQSRGASLLIIPAGQNSSGWITFCNVLMEFMPHLTDRGGTTMDISPPPLPPPPHFNPLGIPTASTIPPIPASVDTMQMQMQMQQSMAALPAAVPLTVVRSGQKRFFFDIGSNPRGTYLRITELVGIANERSCIVVPAEVLQEFYIILGRYVVQATAAAAAAVPPVGASFGGGPSAAGL